MSHRDADTAVRREADVLGAQVHEGRRAHHEDGGGGHRERRRRGGRGGRGGGHGERGSCHGGGQGAANGPHGEARLLLREAQSAAGSNSDDAVASRRRQAKIVVRAVDACEVRAPVAGVHAPGSKHVRLIAQDGGGGRS